MVVVHNIAEWAYWPLLRERGAGSAGGSAIAEAMVEARATLEQVEVLGRVLEELDERLG